MSDDTRYGELSDPSELGGYATLAVDTETDSTNAHTARLVGVSFCGEPGRAFWLPADRYDARSLGRALGGKRLVFHHAKYDLTVLERHGLPLAGEDVFDTMLAAHLLDENRPKGLKRLARDLLGEDPVEYADLSDQLSLFEATPELAEYACADADYTFRLYQRFRPELDATPTLARLYDEYELPTMWVVQRMERAGIGVDTAHLAVVGGRYRERLEELAESIYGHAGGPFQITSPLALSEFLYGRLGLPTAHETRSGRPSVNHAALDAIRHSHPVVPLLIEHRELTTLLTAYAGKLPGLVNAETGRIHCNMNQVGTVTGRMSSNDPNLQSIPRDANIRSAFVAGAGNVLIDADFSQIELRCAAHYSRDPKMLDAFRADLDLHRQTIADIIGKPIDEVTDDERNLAKAVNFGLIYGMGAPRLASSTGLSLHHAQSFMSAYFRTYANIKGFREDVLEYAATHGQIINMYGRRRRFPGGPNRAAFNSLIQSTAADICRDKMIALDCALPAEVRMLLQVHDEILFDAPEERAAEAVALIREIMESPVYDAKGREFRAPIRVDVGVGLNWGSAK
jgi:DNA polymerase-1